MNIWLWALLGFVVGIGVGVALTLIYAALVISAAGRRAGEDDENG